MAGAEVVERQPRIQVVSAWNDADDPTTWSGTVNSLLRNLGDLGALAVPGYRDATPWGPAARLVHAWVGRTGRSSASWVLTPEMRALTAVFAASRRLRRAPGVDGYLLPVGAIGRPVPRPYATWCDMSPAQIAAAHPEHTASFGYSEARGRDLSAILRGQAKIFREADACLSVSQWAAESLVRDHGVPPSKVHVVGAGRNVEPQPPDHRDWSTPRYLFVANSWERKNGPAVVRAFREVRRRWCNAELHLVGQHPAVSEDGVTAHGRLSFAEPGEREQLEQLFRTSTCLVVPSAIEPFGIVYVEAATAGLPSIGTTVGGTTTSVGEGGILVDPNDERALVNAMWKLADADIAYRLGAIARARAGAFTWRACAERVVRAFAPDLADRAGFATFL